MKEIFIGVDIGTTSTKALAYTGSGEPLAEFEQEYPLYSPVSTWKEQDPDEIHQAVLSTLSDTLKAVSVAGGKVAGVGFSAAMHTLIAVDEDGKPLTRVITWADQRSVSEAEELKNSERGYPLYARTGTPIHPMSPLTKLVWFQKHDKELFNRARRWISIKEYVFYRLFHHYLVDYSIASATGLFHLEKLDWDAEALQIAGVSKDQLSRPVPATHKIQGLCKDAAEQLGVEEDIPFIIGASDGVLANLGVGAINHGSVACSIGTSGAIRTVVSNPTVDKKGRLFCYALTEDHWVIGGPINNGGIALRWLRDEILTDLRDGLIEKGLNPYEEFTRMAGHIAPGSNGLLFLPYLTGERAPYWNADTKGMFIGLTMNHNHQHMIRSVMEGVMFQMYSVVLALEETGVKPYEFRANGGFARSGLWRQMMADIFETNIMVPNSHQSSCYGAAVLVMKALHYIDDFSEVHESGNSELRHEPVEEHVQIYRELKPIFIRLARELSPEFKELSDFQRKYEINKEE